MRPATGPMCDTPGRRRTTRPAIATVERWHDRGSWCRRRMSGGLTLRVPTYLQASTDCRRARTGGMAGQAAGGGRRPVRPLAVAARRPVRARRELLVGRAGDRRRRTRRRAQGGVATTPRRCTRPRAWRCSAANAAVEVLAFEHLTTTSGEAPSDTTAMLLERCRPGTELRGRPEAEQHVVVTDLLRSIWAVELPVGHPFRPLVGDGRRLGRARRGPTRRRTRRGSIPGSPSTDWRGSASCRGPDQTDVLLFTDLHAGNVLSGRAARSGCVIDPKPYVGDPHYDVLQHLLNCNVSLQADPIGLLTEVADLAGLDAERVRQWLVARCVRGGPERRPAMARARRRSCTGWATRSWQCADMTTAHRLHHLRQHRSRAPGALVGRALRRGDHRQHGRVLPDRRRRQPPRPPRVPEGRRSDAGQEQGPPRHPHR